MTINNYRKYSLDGIRNNRMNADRKPVISTHKNKEMVKDIVSLLKHLAISIHGVSGY
jgi:hypothetical protein